MILLTLVVFLVGLALGWRFAVGSVYILALVLAIFAVVDVAFEAITAWPAAHWFFIDLVAGQVGYLVGAALSIGFARKGSDAQA